MQEDFGPDEDKRKKTNLPVATANYPPQPADSPEPIVTYVYICGIGSRLES